MGKRKQRSLIERGKSFLNELNGEQARVCFEQAVRNDPSDANAWFWLAHVMEDDEKRLHCYRRVLGLYPEQEILCPWCRWPNAIRTVLGDDVCYCPECSVTYDPTISCLKCGRHNDMLRSNTTKKYCRNCGNLLAPKTPQKPVESWRKPDTIEPSRMVIIGVVLSVLGCALATLPCWLSVDPAESLWALLPFCLGALLLIPSLIAVGVGLDSSGSRCPRCKRPLPPIERVYSFEDSRRMAQGKPPRSSPETIDHQYPCKYCGYYPD